ncbi:MAG: hypothetical protein COU10_03940 [Candidatus Harrisonbacteria bacterium CG10_big_fil_rev_8_21_14_0_10_45_28]|uniref:Four helix bundle protein n=1 Tax=Candidatus Harrisonbacteria bacterium CG10_big_fil_rev_8_21_14_0_10_45_28 TaxID=1974586 RepID=A0A2H0UMD2_9BACT|nr:MAG: hypothetical protein COU10_03940 [Candidatus Harrisonbacteria bacterium CG10_big_fil_rev_8_21_14_0_10_45_28]
MKKEENKWDKVEGSASKSSGNLGSGAYTPQYAKKNAPRYSPKRTVRSFRDLEVYQVTIECSVIICAELIPILEKDKFPLVEGMRNCTLSIPLFIAEAHGMRFADFNRAAATLEQAVQGCNKMIVYLEQVQGLSHNADASFTEDMLNRYLRVRGKMLRLEQSWQKFQNTKR